MPDLFKVPEGGDADFFTWLLGETTSPVLLATLGQTAVGYLYCQWHERAETAFTHANRALYIHHLGVKAQYRRQGVGRALMAAARALAAERGISRIEVDFWSFNDEARAFYTAQGFAPCTERWGRS